MFKVFLTNFGYYLNDEFKTVEEAVERGRKAGFEFTVWRTTSKTLDPSFVQVDDTLVASWSVFGGTSYHNG